MAIAVYGFALTMNIFSKFLELLPKTIYFWVPILGIFGGYVYVGYLFRVITINGINSPVFLLIIALTIGSIWALSLGNGGLLATVIALGLVFYNGGISLGFLAVGIAAGTMGLGFYQTDQERSPDQNLTLLEIMAVVVLLIWAVLVTLATYQILSGVNAAVITGAIAGSYSVVGSQIKASGITNIETWYFLAFLAGLGLAIGWIYGLVTYKVFVLS